MGYPPSAPDDTQTASDPEQDPNEPQEAEPSDASPAPQETEPSDAEEPEEDKSEEAMIAEFEDLVKIPAWAKDNYENFQVYRDYVARDSVVTDDDDTVITNYILRNQYVLISQIYAKDPTIAVTPSPIIGPMPPGLDDFAKTVELMGKKLAVEANFKQVLSGALQDVQTCGIAWLKVSLQQDYSRDPIGAARHDDQLDNVARLRVLMEEYAAGSFTEDDAKFKDMTDLGDTVKKFLITKMQSDLKANPPAPTPIPGAPPDMMGQPPMQPDPGDPRIAQMASMQEPGAQVALSMLPDVPMFLGFNIDEVQPEDVRYDWSITRPEDFYQAKWVAHRVYMVTGDIRARWPSLSDEDMSKAAKYRPGSNGSVDLRSKDDSNSPSERNNLEDNTSNDRCAVWELTDRPTRRRYIWVEGTCKFVYNDVENPSWHKLFTLFPLVFNRVSGQFIPMSDVQLQMPLQDEINQKRTHEREGQKSAYPRYIVAKGAFSEGEKEQLEMALPYSVTELERPDDVAKFFKELMTAPFNPELYDTSKAIRDIEIMAGIPQQAAGGMGGAQFATEVAVANQQMQVQADRRQTVIEEYIHDIYECIIEIALQAFPEQNVKEMVGPMAVWPLLDRDHLWRLLNLEIKAGTSGKPDQQKVLEKWLQFADIANRLGLVVNGPEVFQHIMDEMGMVVNLQKLLVPQMPGMAPGAPGVVPAGGPQAKPAAGGPGAGAPPMKGPPQAPENVPNRPTGESGTPSRPPIAPMGPR